MGCAVWSWRFEDRPSLERVLLRIADEVLAVHGPALWDSEETIEGLLADQADDAELSDLEHRRASDLRSARRAFDEGRDREAIDRYVLLDPSALSAADRRRLHVARQRADDEPGPGSGADS